jgi:hypothetical protein
MEVWVKQWDCPNDSEHNITLWFSEVDALRSTCDEIEDYITNNWDMDDEDQESYASDITGFVVRKQYRDAIERWNDYQNNYNDEYGQWWSVSRKEILGGDESNLAETQRPMAFKASHSGATCRGPCKQFNDYAYADQPDGTHLCRQCSTFQHIFGVNGS